AVMGLSKRLGRARKAQLRRWFNGRLKDVALAAAILANGEARGARAHPEPMDAEGVSFGARFALAGSVVDRDHAPRPQRRCGMVDGRIVAAVNGQDGARAMRPCCGNADRALVW